MRIMGVILSVVVILVLSSSFDMQQLMFKLTSGKVSFTSNAPLEIIKASSDQIKGLINPVNRQFAFSIPISSFYGFNNPLQKEHFNENYMESVKFPSATFTGKIIEKIDFEKDGNYTIRAKGKFNIHGIKQERIIKSTLKVEDRKLIINANFSVLLKEHDIIIPKIVHQKIANEIIVKVEAVFELN